MSIERKVCAKKKSSNSTILCILKQPFMKVNTAMNMDLLVTTRSTCLAHQIVTSPEGGVVILSAAEQQGPLLKQHLEDKGPDRRRGK